MLHSINKLSDEISECLWLPSSSRLLVSVSKVKTAEAVEITQTEKAKRQGQRLLIDALRHKTDWRDANLEFALFDTIQSTNNKLFSKTNYCEVLYATTRMLHAWDVPAYIDKEAYVDGSYTTSCLIMPLIRLGYKKVIFINTESDKIYADLFTTREFCQIIDDSEIEIIQPDVPLTELGVDYYSIKEGGIQRVFSYGYEKGVEYLNKAP